MRALDDYALDELRLIYRLLHAQLPRHMDLMDADLMLDLQAHLQGRAREAGVDVSAHHEWAAWLGEG